jgi:putative peptidoglycan lipid II flippase
MSEHRTLLRSASLITVITLLSRVLGYLRDLRFAFVLGAGVGFDAFVIAYRIPNLLRRLVGEGAVSAAFIPIFSKYLSSENRKEAFAFANAMITIVTCIMTVVVLLGVLLSPWIVRLLAFGFLDTPGKIELTSLLNRIIFPYILFISLSAVAMGMLNSFNRFAAPAFAPVLLNLCIIGFSFATDFFPEPEMALALGVVVGGVAQVLIQIPQLRRCGWRFRPRLDFAHSGVRRAGRLMAPVVLGVGVVQVNVVVDSLFASFLGDGAVTALHLSDRVMELVLGGYAIAIATVILPLMSRQAAEGRTDEMKSTLNFASRIILFITVPSTVGLVILRRPIIQVLFEHGEFGPASTELTAWPLIFFALGLSAFSMVKVIVPAFYSLEDTRTPVKVAYCAMFLNVVLNIAFFHPLQVGGPALATSLSGFFNAMTLIYLFIKREGSFGVRSIVASLVRFCLAAVPLGFLASTLIHWPGFYFDQPLTQRVFALWATIGLSAVVYFVAVSLLRCREVGEVREIFLKRRSSTEADPSR